MAKTHGVQFWSFENVRSQDPFSRVRWNHCSYHCVVELNTISAVHVFQSYIIMVTSYPNLVTGCFNHNLPDDKSVSYWNLVLKFCYNVMHQSLKPITAWGKFGTNSWARAMQAGLCVFSKYKNIFAPI